MEVSIVIPIYNAGGKLKKCIKSVMDQTFTEFELILVNDGSTDESLKICNDYASKDKRIKVINKVNEGCIATRRKGIEVSTGKYIMFIDADDWVDKKILEVLHREITENKCDITICNTYKVISDKAIIKKSNDSEYFKEDKIYEGSEIKDYIVKAYLYGHPFPASIFAKLYKRDLLIDSGKYLKRIEFLGEDLYYNIEIFLKSTKVKIINQALYYYRAGGLTSKYMSYHFNDIVNGYEIQKEIIDEYYDKGRYNGISIMLLNSFKTSLSNLMNSNLSDYEVKQIISEYTNNKSIMEVINNEGCQKYFSAEFLNAIHDKNIEYLHKLGKHINKESIKKRFIISIISKLNII